MRVLASAVALTVLAGCATSKGNERAAQHSADQIRMVAIQKEAQRDLATKQAQANAALYEALARVAESNPDHAPSVAVALAVIGVSGGQSGEGSDNRIVTLQQQQDTALEWTKALAPTVGNLVSGLGIAAINANVQKNMSDNNRDIMLGDQKQNAQIVEAVAGLGTVAATNSGMSVGGDYYDLQDEATVDNSTFSSADTFSETTSTSVSGSYNTETNSETNDQSETYDATEDGFIVIGDYAYSYDKIENSTVSYAGQDTTLGSVLEYLQGLNQPYSLVVNGEVVASSTDGSGDPVTVNCSGPMFSPMPPQCI